MFLLGLSYISTMVYENRVITLLFHSIIMRAGFVLILIVLALSGYPSFFYLAGLIVGFGVVGSALTYRSEQTMHGPTLFQKSFGDKA